MENSAGPTIFKSAASTIPSPQTVKNSGNWFRKNIVKILLVVLGLGVVAEIIFGALTLFAPSSVRNLNVLLPSVNEMGGARFSLVPDKQGYRAGDIVTIDAKLFSGGYTAGSADLVLKYDPLFLKPEGEEFVSVGQIFSEYPAVQVDTDSGLIGVSGIADPNSDGFSGVGSFAKFTFRALKDGSSEVSIDYQPNSTADSNIVLSGSMQDVLSGADNVQIITSSDGSSDQSQVNGGQSCESFTQYCQTSSGKVGTQVCKAGTINQGVCSYDARLTTTCEICVVN